MEEALLEEILLQLRISNRLLATLIIEHHPPLDKQGYAVDEIPVKEWDIKELLNKMAADITKRPDIRDNT